MTREAMCQKLEFLTHQEVPVTLQFRLQ